MQPEHTAKVEASLNRFELICRWNAPLDWDWAHDQLTAWLQQRVDAKSPSVYDGGIPLRGAHDQP
jgi:hypothetical protein